MTNKMLFPETWKEFEEEYGFTDTDEVYTNGTRLIPSFRVEQWLEHLKEKAMSDKYPANPPEISSLYAFIAGYIEKYVIYINAGNARAALTAYCRYYGIADHRLEAIMSTSFESALKLANEWLAEEIVDIHEVGNTIYFDEKYAPQVMKEKTDGQK